MYTLVIADDEEIELKSLSLLIKKELPDIQIVGTAENGAGLVSIIERFRPDMAIVDINMPGVNGLDAIEMIRSMNAPTRFINNTAYSEFEYARRALTLKVDHYILKPQKRADTIAVIRRLCDEIGRAEADRKSSSQVDALFCSIQPVIESEVIYSIFIGEPAVSSFSMWCEIHAARFSGGAMVSMIPADPDRKSLAACDKKELRRHIQNALKNLCAFLATANDSGASLLILVPEEESGARWKAWMNDVLRVLVGFLEKRAGISFYAGVGQYYREFERMPDSYRESIAALRGAQGKQIVFYQNPSSYAGRLESLAARLAACAAEGRVQEMEELLLSESSLLMSDASAAGRLWRLCTDSLLNLAGDSARIGAFGLSKLRDIENAKSPAEGMRMLSESLGLLPGMLERPKTAGANPYAAKAVQIIRESYRADLSLESVAERIGISPFYLSRLLKQETGQTFIGMLTRARMREAVRLARSTRLSIREIAERTGYPNATYFCRVFKKYTGRTIGEFRGEAADTHPPG